MSSEDENLVNFYKDRLAAHRRLYSTQERPWEKLPWSGWTISLLLLLATVLYRFYGQETTFDAVLTSAGNALFDTFVYILPSRLIFALDRWMNPSQPMSETSTHEHKIDAMRRITGLDRPGGMMASVFNARSRALSATGSVFGIKTQSDRPPGLGNIDNSCYQNSILQGLSSLDSLPDFLSDCLDSLEDGQSQDSVAQTLKTLIADLNDLDNNGHTLWTPRVLKSMSSWTQQDAQEYYSKILDDIEKGVTKAVQKSRPQRGLESEVATKDDGVASQHSDDSGYQSATPDGRLSDMKLVRNPLEGLLAQRVACIRCGHSDGISMIPFNCLTLSLGLDKQQHDVYERLDSYTKVEAIEGVECPKCTLLKSRALLTALLDKMKDNNMPEAQLADPTQRLEAVEVALEADDFDEKTLHGACKISPKSKVTTTKTKQIVVARPPQSLVLHINRSVFDPSTFNMIKNSAPVQFPMTLDLGPWCLGSSGGKTGSVDGEELWPTGSMASLIAGDVSPSRLSGPIYELRAAVTHYGRHENGHYICYRKYPVVKPNSEPLADNAEEELAAESDAKQYGETTHGLEAIEQEGEAANGSGNTEKDVETNEATDAVTGEASNETCVLAVDKATDEAADKVTDVATEKAVSDEAGDEGAGSEAADSEQSDAEAPSATSNWWRLSDHNVSKVDEDTVQSLSPGVFMLFYECVDPDMVLDGEEDDMQDAEWAAMDETPREDTVPELERDDDDETMTSAALTAMTETDADARSGSDATETETDTTTISTADSESLPDSDAEQDKEKA